VVVVMLGILGSGMLGLVAVPFWDFSFFGGLQRASAGRAGRPIGGINGIQRVVKQTTEGKGVAGASVRRRGKEVRR
jgi:hypothetical protein